MEENKITIVWPQPMAVPSNNSCADMRQFETGALRDKCHDKVDFEACLCPLVVERYAEYMLGCSYLSDGTRRTDDNWQKGIPLKEYMKSLMRHIIAMWKIHRGYKVTEMRNGKLKEWDLEEICCAIIFNVMGYLHETLKRKYNDSNK